MSTDLDGRTIIVTGGTGRLGNAVTALLLERGATVVVTYANPDELVQLRTRLSPDVLARFSAAQVDVTDEQSVAAFVAGVMKEHGRIDGLANLVGGWASKPLSEVTMADWRFMLDLNLTSAFLMTRAVVPHMVAANYGRILAVGAQSAIQARPKQVPYNVSKVGVMWLMETVSNEVKGHDVTANAILPSAIKTVAEHDANPSGPWVRPEEIAETVAYLMSPASSATSGAKIPVYGKT